VQFVITTTDPLENLYEVTQNTCWRGQGQWHVLLHRFGHEVDKPQATLSLDRELVGDMGLTQQDVGASLEPPIGAATSITSRSPALLQVIRSAAAKIG